MPNVRKLRATTIEGSATFPVHVGGWAYVERAYAFCEVGSGSVDYSLEDEAGNEVDSDGGQDVSTRSRIDDAGGLGAIVFGHSLATISGFEAEDQPVSLWLHLAKGGTYRHLRARVVDGAASLRAYRPASSWFRLRRVDAFCSEADGSSVSYSLKDDDDQELDSGSSAIDSRAQIDGLTFSDGLPVIGSVRVDLSGIGVADGEYVDVWLFGD